MSKIDYHIHAEYSIDSSIKAIDLIRLARDLDYRALAFTEHLDLLPWEAGLYGIPNLTRYKQHITQLQIMNPDIRIVCGIEVGDYHRIKEYAANILQIQPFDLIIGSVHFLTDRTNVSVPLDPPLSPSQIRDYYEQNLCLVSECDIHILAHLGVFKRYYLVPPDESHCTNVINAIFDTMIERNIALEVNLSSMRKPYNQPAPELDYVQIYAQRGGKLISIGSDSHHLEHFDQYYDDIVTLDLLHNFTLLDPDHLTKTVAHASGH